MDVYDDGKRTVGPDRAIGQNPDRFRAKRTLDVDLARHDVGQVRFRKGAQQRERVGATPRQGFGGQRHLWRQCERIAQFGVDRSDCAHGWPPAPFRAEKNGMAATVWRQARVDFRARSPAKGKGSSMADILGIDHVAFAAANLEAACAFYDRLFGARTHLDYAPNGKSLVRQIALGGALLSIHHAGNGLELVARRPAVGGAGPHINVMWDGRGGPPALGASFASVAPATLHA